MFPLRIPPVKPRRHVFASPLFAAVIFALSLGHSALGAAPSRPNIVYILADDLGDGDVQCLNPKHGKIATPHLDRLATQGMTFTDAHSGSSVCTPTRYGVLTGRYAWRTKLQTGVLWGFSPPLIEPGRLTAPALLKAQGYATACLGKWHLGMDWPFVNPEAKAAWKQDDGSPQVDYTQPIKNGPTTVGFDYFYGISASLDMPPYCWIENDHTVGLPTANKALFEKRFGAAQPDFTAEAVLPALAKKAAQFIAERAEQKQPFFLYLPLTAPHTPLVPTAEWKGKSGINNYADFVMETDAMVGELLDALDHHSLAENTLVIFTSDNGSPEKSEAVKRAGHFPNGELRGGKADIWDGGHRVPFFARWPGKIAAGSKSGQLICLTDLLATCADLLEVKLPENAGEDSVSMLPAMLGKGNPAAHEAVVHHSMSGRFAIRQGPWKLELCYSSGGWSTPKEPAAKEMGLPPIQLYDLTADLGEQVNLQAEKPEIVARLQTLLERYVAEGRSTPGARQPNDVSEIQLIKQGK